MALRIEDYGLIGGLHTAAPVDTNGSIDRLCLPRFDPRAVFASLLGTGGNGFWQIAPQGAITKEEYRQANQRLIGNTPQAFTHLALVASAIALSAGAGC